MDSPDWQFTRQRAGILGYYGSMAWTRGQRPHPIRRIGNAPSDRSAVRGPSGRRARQDRGSGPRV